MEKCFIVIRADNYHVALMTLANLVRKINVDISDPRILPEELSDEIKNPAFSYKKDRGINVIATTTESPPKIISRLDSLHVPAHITVVSDIHTVYSKLRRQMADFKRLNGFTKPKRKNL